MTNTTLLRGMATLSFWVADADMETAKQWYTELLGLAPYFEQRGPDDRLAYIEFRLGDYQHELGLINRSYAPKGATAGPGGAIVYWHVDDIAATLETLTAMGATAYEPLTNRGPGFVTASVVDPFGNILGVMYNAHYLDMLNASKKA